MIAGLGLGSMAEEPEMDFIQSKNFTPANRGAIDWVVIHTMEAPEKPGTARNIAKWFAGDTAPQASAHYCVDESECVRSVLEKDVAWHAPGANAKGIGIEHAGFARMTVEWMMDGPQAMLERSARLVADICSRYAIPAARRTPEELKSGLRGICGHKDVTDAFSGGVGHWDPGPSFPWDQYIERVRFYMA